MPASKAQIRATMKFNKKNYKRVPLDLRYTEYEAVLKHKKETGESIAGFFKRMIRENLQSESESESESEKEN